MRRNSLMVSFFLSLESLKTNEYYPYGSKLTQDYDIRAKIASEDPNALLEDVLNVPKEEIEANRKVGTILKLKGNLRISWAFDINYNKNIDLIFFPEENPYLN
ncbi:hypothetical protein, partial [Helicobacter sp. MIT 05-5294]|uniref:hypothetical protein n=1 Tax=Helicobacter sp. MIT 05-5294 TaxID=1548150 RepID=UPI0010FCE383